MKRKFMRIVNGKAFLGVFLFGLLAAAVFAVGTTVFQENNRKQEERLNLGETEDKDLQFAEGTEKTTEIEIADVGVEKEIKVETKEETKEAAQEPETTAEETAQVDSGAVAAAPALNFTTESRMAWPVQGNVILDYSMDTTIYFPTLQQYKCNPAVLIQGDVSTPVSAGASAKVLEVGKNEEIGHFVVLELGNSFKATYGQLKDIAVLAGDYVEAGQVLGYIAEPTKYYVVEGSNLYFKLTCDDVPVDPIDFIE